jgi:hypothetical protein
MSGKRVLVLSSVLALMVYGCGPLAELAGEIEELVEITPSGDIATQEEDFIGFDQVEIGHAFDVEIEQGDEYSIVVRVDESVEDYVLVEKRGNTLVIGLETRFGFSFLGDITMEATVTMPSLARLELSGASRATITGFRSSDAFVAEISGASTLTGDIQTGSTSLDVSGASNVTLGGSAADLTIEASGASDVDLIDYPVADARVEASGASTITVDVSGTLDVVASGASDVYYTGDPTLGETNTSGASSIINLD